MRIDLSDRLIHLSKGTGSFIDIHRTEAGSNVLKMLEARAIQGGTGYIKGNYKCVCFSEAPLANLAHVLANGDLNEYKYQPYGIMVEKAWLYVQGGRPAIYGPDEDYIKLPPEMRYRHVRFELGGVKTIDHTLEREWRIHVDSLPISPEHVTVVVPNRDAKKFFIEHGHGEWHYIALSDLGLKVDML